MLDLGDMSDHAVLADQAVAPNIGALAHFGLVTDNRRSLDQGAGFDQYTFTKVDPSGAKHGTGHDYTGADQGLSVIVNLEPTLGGIAVFDV